MRVKVTNIKYNVGGGKRSSAVPKRLRRGQNLIVYIPDIVATWHVNDIKNYVEQSYGYGFIIAADGKVILNYTWQRESQERKRRYERIKAKADARQRELEISQSNTSTIEHD